MAKKEFKAESKRLLDLMINSIYTHKEIFLREIISNASDAIDKLCYRSLTDENVGLKREDFRITVHADPEARLLTVSDNGIGIPAHEISRIFDKGFTGSNGRSRGGSTGMGLYLCRKLAGHLEIQLNVRSVEGQGTEVSLAFPAA